MRDPNRLDNFYEKIKTYHKENFSDLRFAQLMITFLTWHNNKYGNDGFYLEEKVFLERFKEFIEVIKNVK